MGLTPKQIRFIEEYTGPSNLNGTRAAIAAGYSEKSAGLIASENIRKPYIRDAIAKRLREFSMTADEATERMASMSRGEASTKLVIKSGDKPFVNEEFNTESATDKMLRLHGSYDQPEGGEVKFLIIRDLSEWKATDPEDDVVPDDGPGKGANDE